MTGYKMPPSMKGMDVQKEVDHIRDRCRMLGLSSTDLCKAVGVKPHLITSWGSRYRGDSKFRPRESIYRQILAELERREGEAEHKRVQKLEQVGLRMQPKVVPTPEFDEDTPITLSTHKPSACQVLTSIIQEKVQGMTLVQLAMLIGHIEGNGK